MATVVTVKMPPGSELGRQLKAAEESGTPVRIDTGEGIYTVIVKQIDHPQDDVFANYDPEAAIAALRASRGTLKGVDTARLLEDLTTQREQDSPGRPTR